MKYSFPKEREKETKIAASAHSVIGCLQYCGKHNCCNIKLTDVFYFSFLSSFKLVPAIKPTATLAASPMVYKTQNQAKPFVKFSANILLNERTICEVLKHVYTSVLPHLSDTRANYLIHSCISFILCISIPNIST